jgi:hypothetical protein
MYRTMRSRRLLRGCRRRPARYVKLITALLHIRPGPRSLGNRSTELVLDQLVHAGVIVGFSVGNYGIRVDELNLLLGLAIRVRVRVGVWVILVVVVDRKLF